MNPLFSEYQYLTNLDLHFTQACIQGDIEKVKYLLSSPELKTHADIHTRNDIGLINACSIGNIELVKYLVSSSELIEKADVYAQENACFAEAGSRGDIDMVKILLEGSKTSNFQPQAREHNHNLALLTLFETACYADNLHLVEFLISEEGIKNTKNIQYIVNNLAEFQHQTYIRIHNIFEKVALKGNLDSSLNSSNHLSADGLETKIKMRYKV
jgi:ankyrin repeat protein